MAIHRNFFIHSIIVFLSLVSCSSGIREDIYDYKYDPSFLRTSVDSSQFDDSTELETGANDGLSKISGLERSVKTISVDSFGPKADGAHDDSKVSNLAAMKKLK